MSRRIRTGMGIASAVLFGIELLIGLFADGWVRWYLGDVLVVILIYTLWRTVSPMKPKHGLCLPLGILLFSFAVEFLQRWGFCDKMHITNHLLRILIGTGFSVKDLVSYCIGIVPCMICELFLHYTINQKKTQRENP